ncbi:unnamed protein product [Closterium sp. Naga37s-1]|nr:unnamed protein product [Closterium sp. Naga37s-1]
MTLRSLQRSQRRSSTGAQPAQRTPSHNEKRSSTPDAARAGGRYKRRKTLSDARATRGRSGEEPDDGERPARRASLRVAGGGKDGARKAKRKEREEKPVSLILPPIPSSAGPLFQVRAGLTDFRARQLAMAVEAGVTSEVVWALNALQLISFSLKDTWQQGAGPLSKAPQLLSALVSVVASWRACSLERTDAATWRAMRGGPEGGGPAGSDPPGRGGGGSRSGGSGRLSRLLHDPLGERIRTYFPHSADPPLPRPISVLHPPSADDPLSSAAAATAAAGAGGMSAYGRGHRGGGVESRGGDGGGEAGGGRGNDGGGLAAGGAAGGAGGKAEGDEVGEGGGWEGALSAEEREVWWAERALFNHSSSASSTGGGRGGGRSSSSAGERLQCAVAASSVLRNLSFLPHCASAMAALPACVAMLVGAMEDFQRVVCKQHRRKGTPCRHSLFPTCPLLPPDSPYSPVLSSAPPCAPLRPLRPLCSPAPSGPPCAPLHPFPPLPHGAEEEEVVSNAVDTFANIAAAIDLSSYPAHQPPLPSPANPLASALPPTLSSAAPALPASLTRSAATHPAGDTGPHGMAVGASGSGADAGADAAAGGEGGRGVMRWVCGFVVLLVQQQFFLSHSALLPFSSSTGLLIPASSHPPLFPLPPSSDPHVQATALSCVALAAHASPAAKYSLAREPQ